jgi:hypothetical protein
MAEDRRDVGLLAVTSADRLNAGWTAAMRARERGLIHARSHIERLFADLPPHCGLVTLLDGHPATRSPGSAGSTVTGCGFSASSISARPAPLPTSIATIDTNAIIAAAQAITPAGWLELRVARACLTSAPAWAHEAFRSPRTTRTGSFPHPTRAAAIRLTDEYVTTATQVVSQQLSTAGVRLAFILNRALRKP